MRFSIIVPSFNRPEPLRNCLAGLACLDYPPEQFEVIVVDDGGAEPLDAIAASVRTEMSLRIRRQENAGPARARNFGAQLARGELLAFIDDDCVAQREWLRRFDQAASMYPGCLLGGATRNGCHNNIFADVNQVLLETVNDWFSKHNSPLTFFASNNIVVPAREFRQIGGFSASFPKAAGEDRDFCARWLDAGRHMIAIPEARVDHFHAQNLRAFAEMHFRYGRGAARFHKCRGTSPSQFVFSGLYARLLGAIGERIGYVRGTGLLAMAQLATCAGFCWEKPKLSGEIRSINGGEAATENCSLTEGGNGLAS